MWPFLIGIIVLLAILTIIIGIYSRLKSGPVLSNKKIEKLPYQKKDWLLTKAERSFFGCLTHACNDNVIILIKVRMADLFWLPKNTENYLSYFNKIKSKHIDFVLCDRDSLKPILGIELDDKSHQRPTRQKRDQFVNQVFNDATLPLLRIPAHSSYNMTDLQNKIKNAIRLSPSPATN